MYIDDFSEKTIDEYSLWEDNFETSKVDIKCTDYSKNYTINEEEFWDSRKKHYKE